MKIEIKADLQHAAGITFKLEEVKAELEKRLKDLAFTAHVKEVEYLCTLSLTSIKITEV
jgi:hypothetical protein